MLNLPKAVLFGAAYYHEYQPSPRLDEDLDLMKKAGFTVIRVGDSTWSTCEPDDGVFELDWLQPVLDGALERGISVVLGTPTYAVPPWLARKYPEIAAERRSGQRIGWGARQEMDFTHAAFLHHAERIIRAVVGRYHDHPAVIGFQLDNEPGLELLHNHGVFQAFVDDLRRTYGDVETLNKEWGLVYWSHRLTTWADLWTPDNNMQPQYDLAWRRFQARLTTTFIEWQAKIVREIAGHEKFVTTDIAYYVPALDDHALTQELDVTAGNPYYGMQDSLALPNAQPVPQGWAPVGTWTVFKAADRMYSSRQEPFLVTETNAGGIGDSAMNFPGYDGQWRQLGWAFVARGAKMMEYWHWHTLHFGTETQWVGVLPHDQLPGRVYNELSRLGHEFLAADDYLHDLVPDGHVGLVWSNDSRFGLSGLPCLRRNGAPDPDSYSGLVDPFHRGLFDAGIPVRMIHDVQLVSAGVDVRTPEEVAAELTVLVVSGLYIASDELLVWLRRYAEAGGHLVLGPRTGYADHEARARTEVKPALISEAAGVSYQEFSNLMSEIRVQATSDGPDLPEDAAAVEWVDLLQAHDGATVLAEYLHPHFGSYPAMVTNVAGAGRITTVGALPNPAYAKAIAELIAPGGDEAWRKVHGDSVTVSSATSAGGARLRIVHNWSWEPAVISVPTAVQDILDHQDIPAGASLTLQAWDVKVLLEQ